MNNILLWLLQLHTSNLRTLADAERGSRVYLTPPRTTRAASPPRTRYDFQSPQPSDARFAAQFRAAATASANGKKGELRRMRDEYAALKRDLADKKSRR